LTFDELIFFNQRGFKTFVFTRGCCVDHFRRV